MPFTPYHFGVGLAVKATIPGRFYLVFFIALQVCTDVEVLYNLVFRRTPLHGFLHTFIGATILAGIASALVLVTIVFRRRASARRNTSVGRLPRAFYASVLATAVFATWSHVALDGIMHRDLEPFWPITDTNPFLGLVGRGTLHLACLVLRFFGTIFLLVQMALNQRR